MRKHTAMKCSRYLYSYLQQASTQKVALGKVGAFTLYCPPVIGLSIRMMKGKRTLNALNSYKT